MLGLLALDRAGAALASRAVAAQVQSSLRTAHAPDVELDGFPFLTQALAGRYERVRVRTGPALAAGVQLARLDATLEGVRIPLSHALRRRVARVPAGQLRMQGLVPYAELVRRADERFLLVPDGERLRLTPEGDRLRVTGLVEMGRRRVEVTVLSRVEVVQGELLVTAESYTVGSAPADPRLVQALEERTDLRFTVEGLPPEVRVTGVQVQPDGLLVVAAGTDAVLLPG